MTFNSHHIFIIGSSAVGAVLLYILIKPLEWGSLRWHLSLGVFAALTGIQWMSGRTIEHLIDHLSSGVSFLFFWVPFVTGLFYFSVFYSPSKENPLETMIRKTLFVCLFCVVGMMLIGQIL